MVELVEERLCGTFVRLFRILPEELLVFNKSVDMILSSMFTCGNLKNKCYTEQGLLSVAVRHHLGGKEKMSGGWIKLRNVAAITIIGNALLDFLAER